MRRMIGSRCKYRTTPVTVNSIRLRLLLSPPGEPSLTQPNGCESPQVLSTATNTTYLPGRLKNAEISCETVWHVISVVVYHRVIARIASLPIVLFVTSAQALIPWGG